MASARFAIGIGVSLFALCACESPKTLYRWGLYEESVYKMLDNPDGTNVPAEIQGLSAEIERDLAEGRRAAPGVHAHLGYLYFLTGNPDSAKLEFEAEKAAYPESTVFIDGVLRRMKS